VVDVEEGPVGVHHVSEILHALELLLVVDVLCEEDHVTFGVPTDTDEDVVYALLRANEDNMFLDLQLDVLVGLGEEVEVPVIDIL
jgi:hypothetical protein